MAYRTRSPSPRLSAACSGRPPIIEAFLQQGVTSILEVDVNDDPVSITLAAEAYATPACANQAMVENALRQIVLALTKDVVAAVAENERVPPRATLGISSKARPPVPSTSLVGAINTTGRVYKRSSDTQLENLRRRAVAKTSGTLPSSSHPGEERAILAMAEAIFCEFTKLGTLSSLWEPAFDNPRTLAARKELALATWMEIPLSSMRGHFGELMRWQKHCRAEDICYKSPTATDVGVYVRRARDRGETVPARTVAEFTWLQRELGLQLHAHENIVRAQTSAPERISVQAAPPEIYIVIASEHLALSVNKHKALIGSTAAWLWHGSVRFGHFQRSAIKAENSWFISAISMRGKARTRGLRKPMIWTVARWGLNDRDFTKPVLQAQKVLANIIPADEVGQHHYLLPDFTPAGARIDEVTGLAPRPMSPARFLHYLCVLLEAPPYRVPRQDLADLTRHSFRHGLVTVGQRLVLPPHVQATLGIWGAQGGDQGAKSEVRRMAMPLLYAAEADATQATGRAEIVRAMNHALISFVRQEFRVKTKRVDLFQYNSVERFRPCLDDLVLHWPEPAASKIDTAAAIAARLGKMTPQRALTPLPQEETLPIADGDDCSSSLPSESSSESGAAEPVQPQRSQVSWVCTHKQSGKLHLIDSGACSSWEGTVTLCGKRFSQPIMGTDMLEAEDSGRPWSPKCFSKLPKSIRDAWAGPQ